MLSKRFSIIQLFIVSGAIFFISIGTLLVKEVSDAYQDSRNADQSNQLVDLLAALDDIAHEHAVERGLTAGFLTTGNLEQKAKVDRQRTKADAAEQAFTFLLSQSWPSKFAVEQRVGPLLATLAGKDRIRDQVDTGQAPQAFEYYSKLNADALQALQTMALSISDSELSHKINMALLLASIKERTGQIRGKVNGILGSRKVSSSAQSELRSWSTDRTKNIVFALALYKSDDEQLSNALLSPKSQQLEDVVKLVTSPSPDISTLPDSATWFAFATEVIIDIKRKLDSQWVSVREQSHLTQARENRYILLLLCASGAVIGLLFLINRALIVTLRVQLGTLTSSLEKITNEGDLTVNVELDAKNELGSISRAVNQTIQALKALIIGLSKSISTGTRLSSQLDEVTTSIVGEAAKTQLMAEDISQATQQISTASLEIAESSANTLSCAQELEQTALSSVDQNNLAKGAVQTLNTSMQAMSDDADAMVSSLSKISSFLETINSLADQTNLLALNAAIEAARAGEQGRGFAVVADEVRSLAGSSKQASDQISSLLDELHSVSDSVMQNIEHNTKQSQVVLEATDCATQTSQGLGEKIKQVEGLSTSVASAAEQQTASLAEVSKKVEEVLRAASHEREMAQRLRDLFDDTQLNNSVLQRTMDGFIIE
jgi:methyl-accepting chemotaxis protein